MNYNGIIMSYGELLRNTMHSNELLLAQVIHGKTKAGWLPGRACTDMMAQPSSSPALAPAAPAAVRTAAMSRRLRARRQEARLRVRLLADAAILGEHHSSAVPRVVGLPRSDLRPDGLASQVVLLRQELRELRAMVSALLFFCFLFFVLQKPNQKPFTQLLET